VGAGLGVGLGLAVAMVALGDGELAAVGGAAPQAVTNTASAARLISLLIQEA
jgi:tetrahydromethanopterin S-methyltransferase subunit C